MRLRKDGQPDRRSGRVCPRGEASTSYRHGHRETCGGSPEYRAWRAMKARCLNPNDPAYDRYGGRGITIDPRWVDSFEAFLADMGSRPEGRSLDRIDNDGDYTKVNCRWATKSQQSMNTRMVHNITIGNETRPLMHWAKIYNLDPAAIRYRIKVMGWDEVRAILTPKARRRDAINA